MWKLRRALSARVWLNELCVGLLLNFPLEGVTELGIWWRLLFAPLIACTYVVFYLLQHSNPNQSWNPSGLTVNAQSHAGVLGVFAGFIAAVVVIFLTNNQNDDNEVKVACRCGAIATLLSAFLAAILGSFQYASFTGFAEYWQALETNPHLQAAWLKGFGGAYPSFVFNVLAVDYLLAVYLGFYGLVLAVNCLTKESGLSKLTYFMLTMVFLLGSAWVFLDFGLSPPIAKAHFPYSRVGLFYTIPVLLAFGSSYWFSRIRTKYLLTLLYVSSVICILVLTASGIAYAALSAAGRTWVEAHLGNTIYWTIWVIVLTLAVLFSCLIFCANALMDQLALRDRSGTNRPAPAHRGSVGARRG